MYAIRSYYAPAKLGSQVFRGPKRDFVTGAEDFREGDGPRKMAATLAVNGKGYTHAVPPDGGSYNFV